MPPPPPQTMALGQLRFSELGAEEPPMGEESLEGLKALTAKLKLQTRRPSYLEWEARVRGQPWGSRTPGGAEGIPGNPKGERDGGGVCGFPTVGEALEWLRTELVSRGWGARGARGGAQPWQGGLQLAAPQLCPFFLPARPLDGDFYQVLGALPSAKVVALCLAPPSCCPAGARLHDLCWCGSRVGTNLPEPPPQGCAYVHTPLPAGILAPC